MKNIFIILVSVVAIIGVIVILNIKGKGANNASTQTASSNNTSSVVDGTQYVDITAKGGYSPRTISAQAGVPTVIRMHTQGTFDCSASVVISSLNYQKIMQSSETVEIPVPQDKASGRLQGVCGMGMYSFAINFQ